MTDVDIEIEIEEVLDSCSVEDIREEIIPWLIYNDYIKEKDILKEENILEENNILSSPFDKACRKLIGKKHFIKKEKE